MIVFLALAVGTTSFGAAAAPDGAGLSALQIQFDRSPDESLDCRYARDDASRAAADLAHEAHGLAACAERGDFRDACLGEFWRLRRAQTDFEAAVSAVQASCG